MNSDKKYRAMRIAKRIMVFDNLNEPKNDMKENFGTKIPEVKKPDIRNSLKLL